LVARWSSNVQHDGTEPDEHRHCGNGINFAYRLPIGRGPFVDVEVIWEPGFVRVSTPEASWTTTKGAAGPGFGKVWFPLPRDRGIGWARSIWTFQRYGGTAELVSWGVVAPVGAPSACP
jgi:hypothetical protein